MQIKLEFKLIRTSVNVYKKSVLPRDCPSLALKHGKQRITRSKNSGLERGADHFGAHKNRNAAEKPEKDVDDRATNTRDIEEGFNGVSAALKSGCNVFQGCRPRHDGNVAAVATFNHNYIEAGDAKT
ncbi:hypothetical protein [Megasphaera massiliensis]|uniref:hypothetical protein n=1 Tax=Megasphaera massiliensis TaxID=1232428 RepID=UPI003AB80D2C